jgi:hypothetical protein
MTLKIKGWERFQHFKDRKPPWIKLYRDLLDDIKWHELDGEAAKHLVMLWLIASESDGELPSIKELAFRLRISKRAVESTVSKLSHWLIQDDIKLISDDKTISGRYQDDISVKVLARVNPETEKETEKETEADIKNDISGVRPQGLDLKSWERWKGYRKATKKPIKPVSVLAAQRELAGFGEDQAAVVERSIAHGWQGLFALNGDSKQNGNGSHGAVKQYSDFPEAACKT